MRAQHSPRYAMVSRQWQAACKLGGRPAFLPVACLQVTASYATALTCMFFYVDSPSCSVAPSTMLTALVGAFLLGKIEMGDLFANLASTQQLLHDLMWVLCCAAAAAAQRRCWHARAR
jgi:hypothetical protein